MISEHRHGGDPSYEFEKFGVSPRPVIDFSVNLNPLGPPPFIKERWGELFNNISHYPSPDGKGIKEFYTVKYGIEPNEVFAGNGASEILYYIFRVLSPKFTISFYPSYSDYVRAALSAGSSVREISLWDEKCFSHSLLTAESKTIRIADIVILGNPNNPTGNIAGREFILELCERYNKSLFIVDESFMPFSPQFSKLSFLCYKNRPKNLILVQSLTKMYCLPGLRIGACIADNDIIKHIESMANPWRLNTLADWIAPALAHCGEYEQDTVRFVDTEKKRIYCMLKKTSGLHLFPSEANFILAKWKHTNTFVELLKALLINGIFVRDCRNFHGLGNSFFRFAVLTNEYNDRLIEAIKSFKGLQ
jgi:threonine-phosphate decarboxylase